MNEYDIDEATTRVREASAGWGKFNPLPSEAVQAFRETMYRYYKKYRRPFPWRETEDPYHILVSEVMLQQTQTSRVAEKFPDFIAAFPTVEALATAELSDVMRLWQGMGYNRRGMMLHRLARRVMDDFNGKIPRTLEELVTLPGIGKATASSFCAFAFDMPVVFIETNIRAVYIHFFFPEEREVDDRDILPLVEETLDKTSPHHWYSALMDYGVMLKKVRPNPSRRSRHYKKQAPFEGSDRQVRGRILKLLLEEPGLTGAAIEKRLEDEGRVKDILARLLAEGLVTRKGKRYYV